MTMAEIEGRLPAGFHDATLLNVAIDYEKLEARIEFKLWLPNEAERETYARATLLLENIQYLIIEPPSLNTYINRAEHDESTVDGYITNSRGADVVPPLCDGMFAYSLFVFNWNSSIHVAATSAKLEPENLLEPRETSNEV